SLRLVVEAVPDIVDAARNRHYRRLPVDDVLLQSSRHVGGLVTADAGVEDLYLEVRIVAVQDLFHESKVTSRLRDAVPESHNSVAGFQFHLALGGAVKYFCEDGESHQVFQAHGKPLRMFETPNQSQTRTGHQEDSISNSSRFFAPLRLCGKKAFTAKTQRRQESLREGKGGSPSMNHTRKFSRREALRMAATGLG